MTIKSVIFDFDGTLADTLPVCFYAFGRVFKEIDGREVTAEDAVAMFGPSEVGILEQNIANQHLVTKAVEDFYAYYEQEHQKFVAYNTDIASLLVQLREQGLKIGIVTGKARRSLDISMKVLEMEGLFDVIITSDDVEKHKPHPEGIFKAMDLLQVEAEETLFIGDSHADVRAGKAAGVTTIGVHWLPTVQSTDFDPKPDYLFTNVKQLIDFLA
ncbi:HAD family hydrolase [Paenibacillus sp. N1-5-1-14]|uniref:HAD family hydrolase n=1 Tax=Paenibacillus radicibacter TaxID=2972488 RepID=UPI002159534B|nr:HAD family hydrolase [Paenibacillus radicibacter]MCR8641254.1 HAD family hydrolase [Paenibacillus radicibacter]